MLKVSLDAAVFRVEDGNDAEGEPTVHVRFTPAEPSDELENSPYGWHMSTSGNHFVWRGVTSLYIDPSLLVPLTLPCRTTLVHYQGSWKILDKCVEWQLLLNVTAALPCGEADCITILSSGDEDPEIFGVKVEGVVESYSGASKVKSQVISVQMVQVPLMNLILIFRWAKNPRKLHLQCQSQLQMRLRRPRRASRKNRML